MCVEDHFSQTQSQMMCNDIVLCSVANGSSPVFDCVVETRQVQGCLALQGLLHTLHALQTQHSDLKKFRSLLLSVVHLPIMGSTLLEQKDLKM